MPLFPKQLFDRFAGGLAAPKKAKASAVPRAHIAPDAQAATSAQATPVAQAEPNAHAAHGAQAESADSAAPATRLVMPGERAAQADRVKRAAQNGQPVQAVGAAQSRLRAAETGAIPHTSQAAPGSAAASLLKRYRPLQTRAAGGFGSVEICLDRRLQRRVAIKRMPLASEFNRSSAETTAAALAEARTASMLQHPNIVSVIDFTYDSGYAYLVMEYVDGMSLEEFLEQVDGHSLTYDEVACVADALVQALSYAHENGVLHLDIKPANVLIDRSGHVKLADFGMATLTSAAGFGGARGGTIGYMPPEQLNGDEVDERTDIFSLATVLYEALFATTPFRAGTPADSLKKIDQGVLYPSDLLPDISESAEEALLGALSPAPQDRMTSVADFGDQFLERMGNAREGRKSLARMIAKLTSDDEETGGTFAPGETARAERVWELDPAEGYLGSRTVHARRIVIGAVSGLTAAATAWALLGAMQVADPLPRSITALAIGAASGLAPQIGSALAFTGFLMLVVNASPLLGVLPVAVLTFALATGWWLVWGRTEPAASAILTATTALFCTTGNPIACAPLIVAIAGYFLPARTAAPSMALGIVFGKLVAAAVVTGGVLPIETAATALADPVLWLSAAGLAAAAAGISALLGITWNRYRDSRGTGIAAVAYLIPLAASILLICLAHPMEIASLPTVEIAIAAGAGTLSSIIVWICVYLLGYRRNQAEGDRS